MSEEARRPYLARVAGGDDRLPGIAGLGRACLTTLVALVAQFGLGMWLNLYVAVPGSDQHAGIVQEITNGPLALTVHALLGAFLIVAAIVLLIRAVRTRDAAAAALTAAGLAAILGAFAAGELFVRDGKSGTSLWMAVLTGIALLCYIGVQALVSSARLTMARTVAEDPPAPLPRRSYPGPEAAATMASPAPPQQPPWPPAGSPARRRPAPYETPISGPQPSYPPASAGVRPRSDPPYQGRRRAAPRPDRAGYEYPDYPRE